LRGCGGRKLLRSLTKKSKQSLGGAEDWSITLAVTYTPMSKAVLETKTGITANLPAREKIKGEPGIRWEGDGRNEFKKVYGIGAGKKEEGGPTFKSKQ